jgi:hypothetical protein
VPVSRRRCGVPKFRFFLNQLAGLRHIPRHENGRCDFEAFEHPLVKGGELGGTLGRKLKLSLDFLGRNLAQVLVDDVARVLQVDREGDDLHGAAALAVIKAAARKLGDVKLDRFVQPIDGVVHPRDLEHARAIVRHERGHDFSKHHFDGVAHSQGLTSGIR